MRAAVGITAVVQGVIYLADPVNPTLISWLVGLTAVLSGAALTIGLLTPVAGILVGLGNAGIALSRYRLPSPNLFYTNFSILFVVIMTVAVVLLGPGAFSLDARFFGRREIIIPHAPRSLKS